MNAQEFRRALTSSNITDRIDALRAYEAVADPDIPYIQEAIRCPNPELHMSALDVIESFPFTKTKQLLGSLAVFGATPEIRARAVRLAAQTQYDEATHIILEATRDVAHQVELTAIESLQGRKCTEVYDFLAEKLRDPGVNLDTPSPEEIQALKQAALASLASLEYNRAIPLLVDIFFSDPALRQATRDALIALRSKQVSSALLKRIDQLRSAQGAVRLQAIQIVSSCGVPRTDAVFYDELLLIQYEEQIGAGQPHDLVRGELVKSASPKILSKLTQLLDHYRSTPEGEAVCARILPHLYAMPRSRTLSTLIPLLASPQRYIQQPTVDHLIQACNAEPRLLPKALALALRYPDDKLHQPQHLPHILHATLTSDNLVSAAKTIRVNYLKAVAAKRARYDIYVLTTYRRTDSFSPVFSSFFLPAYLAGNRNRRRHLTQILFRVWQERPELHIIGFLLSKHMGYKRAKEKDAAKNMLEALVQQAAGHDRMIQELLAYAHDHPKAWNLVHDLLQSLPADRRHAQLIAFLGTTFDLNMLIALVDEGVEQARDLIHQYLDDSTIQLSDAERQQVVSLLEKVGNQSSIEPLTREGQRRECPKARVEAVRVLGVLMDDSAAPALIELLTDTDAGVVKQAVISLGQIAHFLAIPRLTERRDKDPAKAVKREAQRSLKQIFERYQAELAAKPEDDAREDTIHLIGIFESLGDQRALPLLLARLKASNNPDLTIALVNALRAIGSPSKSIPALQERLEFERNENARFEIQNAIDSLTGSKDYEIVRLASSVCSTEFDRDALLGDQSLEHLISGPERLATLRTLLASAYHQRDDPDSFVTYLNSASDLLCIEVLRASGVDPQRKIKKQDNRIGKLQQVDIVIHGNARVIYGLRRASILAHPTDEHTDEPRRKLTPEEAKTTATSFGILFGRAIEFLCEAQAKA